MDFWKLVFAVFIFLVHLGVVKYGSTGPYAVHFYFVVTGMLMANSICKTVDSEEPGKSATGFVLKKIKSISWQFLAAVLVNDFLVVLLLYRNGELTNVFGLRKNILKFIPELLMIHQSGANIYYNGVSWYLSAMVLAILPISYLLYRKKDFALYVFAPFTAIITFGYICAANNYRMLDQNTLYGLFMGGFIRAVCGLCFGICAYMIYARLKSADVSVFARTVLTVLEIIIYVLFIMSFFKDDDAARMCVLLILPCAVAITFSGMSFINFLFRFKFMKCFAPMSLSLFLNHCTAISVVDNFFPGTERYKRILLSIVFVIMICFFNYTMVYLIKHTWKKNIL